MKPLFIYLGLLAIIQTSPVFAVPGRGGESDRPKSPAERQRERDESARQYRNAQNGEIAFWKTQGFENRREALDAYFEGYVAMQWAEKFIKASAASIEFYIETYQKLLKPYDEGLVEAFQFASSEENVARPNYLAELKSRIALARSAWDDFQSQANSYKSLKVKIDAIKDKDYFYLKGPRIFDHWSALAYDAEERLVQKFSLKIPGWNEGKEVSLYELTLVLRDEVEKYHRANRALTAASMSSALRKEDDYQISVKELGKKLAAEGKSAEEFSAHYAQLLPIEDIPPSQSKIKQERTDRLLNVDHIDPFDPASIARFRRPLDNLEKAETELSDLIAGNIGGQLMEMRQYIAGIRSDVAAGLATNTLDVKAFPAYNTDAFRKRFEIIQNPKTNAFLVQNHAATVRELRSATLAEAQEVKRAFVETYLNPNSAWRKAFDSHAGRAQDQWEKSIVSQAAKKDFLSFFRESMDELRTEIAANRLESAIIRYNLFEERLILFRNSSTENPSVEVIELISAAKEFQREVARVLHSQRLLNREILADEIVGLFAKEKSWSIHNSCPANFISEGRKETLRNLLSKATEEWTPAEALFVEEIHRTIYKGTLKTIEQYFDVQAERGP